MSNRLPELGDRVIDKVTGFKGVIVSHSKHLTGCDRMFVEPQVGNDGKRVEGCWLDIDMLDIVEPNAVEVVKYERQAPGGVDLPPSQ